MQRGTRLDNGLGALFAAARRRVDPDRPNNSVPGLTVWGDTVRADRLAKTNVIRRTESVVFRAEVARDGVVVPDLEVTVQIGRTAPLPMVFGTARRGEPHYRTDPWPVPLNLRAGPLPYTLTALDRATGTSASWSPLPGPRSGLTILPYAYTVVVGAVRLDHAVRVAATVTRTVPGERGRAAVAMTNGGVTAVLGFDHTVGPSGTLAPLRSTRLLYSTASGDWSGIIGTDGLGPGQYIVQVRAEDLVPTPNVGTGNSLPFTLARGA